MSKTNELIKHTAEQGLIYKSKIDGALLANVIYLGINDSIDNYEQVDESELLGDEKNSNSST